MTTFIRPAPTTSKPLNTLIKVKTSYNDPRKQELSNKRFCFIYEKLNHIVKDYSKDEKLAVIEELLDLKGSEEV